MFKHARERPYVCHYCKGTFRQKGNLEVHIKKLHCSADSDERNFKCKLCSCVFRRLGNLNTHFAKFHTIDKEVYLQEHMRKSKERRAVSSEPKTRKIFKCDFCNAVCNSLSERKDHLSKFHKVERNGRLKNYAYNSMNRRGSNVCEYCKKCFEKPSQLLRHKRIHTGERPFKCELCPKAFSQKGSLQVHMFKHTKERPYVCHYCKHTFSQKGNLEVHIKKLHCSADINERNFKCILCSCSFKRLGSLNTHFTKFHVISKQGNSKRNEKQKISAQNCNYKANTNSSDSSNKENEVIKSGGAKEVLFSTTCVQKDGKIQKINVVQRNIKNPKLHACSYCSKKFQRISDLISHFRMHSLQEKPLKCKICYQCFACNSELADHLKMHNGIKSYSCSICSKTFSTSSSLKLHKNKHLINGELSSEDLDEIKRVTHKKTDTCETLEETSQIEKISQPSVYTGQIDVPSINGNVLLTENGSIVDMSSELEDDERENNETIDDSSLQCEESNFSFKKISYAKDNLQNQNELYYKCQFCPCTFTKPKALNKHMEIHTSLGKYVCEHCGKVFPSEAALKSHSGVHISGFPWACPVCGSGFKSYAACRRHISVHPKFGPIKYKPMAVESNEENKFNEASNETEITYQPGKVNEHKNQNVLSNDLKNLISFLQPGQHVTITEDDGFSFSTVTSEGLLDGHFAIDEKNISNSSASSSQNQIFDSSLQNCIFLQVKEDLKTLDKNQPKSKYCLKRFKECSDLITHLKTHKDERPFQSSLLQHCHKRFSLKTTASSHMKTHTKDRPFSCFICSKNFTTPGSLEIHMRLHTGLKPFSCHLCDAKFRTSGHKKAHLKKHLKESENGLKEGQSNIRKSNDMEGHFLENLLKKAEYFNLMKSKSNNGTVPVDGIKGSPYLVPLNTKSIVSSVPEGDKKSLSDYLINLDESGNSGVESARYLLSVKDGEDNDEGFIVEKLNDDQIIVTVTKGNAPVFANPNDSIPTTNQNQETTGEIS